MICHKQIIPTKLHFLLYWQLVESIGVLPNVFLQYEELKKKIINFLGNQECVMDFDTYLDASRATLIPGTLPALNLPIKIHPSSG